MSSEYIYHYVYRITNVVEKKHYYGKRSSKIDPKLDLGIKYFSSSKDKSFLIDQKNNPQNYRYKIVGKFLTNELAFSREIKLHFKFNCAGSEKFYNKANSKTSKFSILGTKSSIETRQKISKSLKGKPKTQEHIKNYIISRIKSNKTRDKQILSQEHKNAISSANKDKPKSLEQRLKITGENHPTFIGYYISPELSTPTITKQTQFGITLGWYSNLDKLITKCTYRQSKYLNTRWTWEELENKTFRDLGFNFIPK